MFCHPHSSDISDGPLTVIFVQIETVFVPGPATVKGTGSGQGGLLKLLVHLYSRPSCPVTRTERNRPELNPRMKHLSPMRQKKTTK